MITLSPSGDNGDDREPPVDDQGHDDRGNGLVNSAKPFAHEVEHGPGHVLVSLITRLTMSVGPCVIMSRRAFERAGTSPGAGWSAPG